MLQTLPRRLELGRLSAFRLRIDDSALVIHQNAQRDRGPACRAQRLFQDNRWMDLSLEVLLRLLRYLLDLFGTQREVHLDKGLEFNRPGWRDVRPVSPVADCSQSRSGQKRVPENYMCLPHSPLVRYADL